MKLWILRPIENLPKDDNPWNPWYDKCFGFIVAAPSEESARDIADKSAGDENRGEFLNQRTSKTTNPWLNPDYSTCKELKAGDFNQGVVMKDFASA